MQCFSTCGMRKKMIMAEKTKLDVFEMDCYL